MILAALKRKLRLGSKYTMQEASALYTTSAVSDLAISLIGIYLPIYIYQLSQDNLLFDQDPLLNGLVWNCIFYLIISLSVLFTITLFTKSMFAKLHLKTSLFLGILLRAFSLVFLNLSSKSYLFLIPSAICWGFRIAFYWIPYHIFFVRRADDGDHKYGTEIGMRSFFSGISTSMGPLLGGLLIANLGFNSLFIISTLLLLASAFPTLMYVNENKHKSHTFKDVLNKFFFNKKYFNTSVAFAGRVTSAVVFAIFWSVLLYLKLENFVEIGLLNTISGILATILMLLVGKIIDSHGKKSLHAFSVGINSLLHISRMFLVSPASYYLNNILDKINSTAFSTAFVAATYEKTSVEKVSNFMVYRELALHISRSVLLVSIISLILLTGTWKWVFIIGAIGSGLTFMINY